MMDIALAGQMATIECIEQDYEGKSHVCVVLDNDPGKDMGMLRQPGHRFFFDTRKKSSRYQTKRPQAASPLKAEHSGGRHRQHLSRRRRIRGGSGSPPGRVQLPEACV